MFRFEKPLGEKKGEERRSGNSTGLVVSPASPGQLPARSKSASGAFAVAAVQSLLGTALHVKVAPLLSHAGSVPCPQGSHWPQEREGAGWAGTAGLSALTRPEPAQRV